MGRKQAYEVNLSQCERDHLVNLVCTGTEDAQKLTRARILLKADQGWVDQEITNALDVSMPTVGRIRKRYATEGLDSAISRKAPQRDYESKMDGAIEAQFVALTCSEPTEGHARWSLRLLAERVVTLEKVSLESISHETVRKVLKKTNSSLGRTNNG